MIDFHCHVDLYPDPHAVVEECIRREIYVLSVTTTPSAWHGTSALSEGSMRIRTGLGLHPQLAHERKRELPLFDRLLPQTRYVGEVGLDGGVESKPHWSDQLTVFEHILDACVSAGGRILSIHSRRAATAVLDALERFPQAGDFVFHWFSGSRRELARAVDLGCWFSVGPAMIAAELGRDLVARMPRERVLTETDGPFVKIDGHPVHPWNVDHAVTSLCRLWSLAEHETPSLLKENLARLVSKP